MLFLDTSALLAMIGGNSATPTVFTMSLLQVRKRGACCGGILVWLVASVWSQERLPRA
jgi:hypothetical protein